jgi:hypothetical protein
MKLKPSDYRGIEVWHLNSGSRDYYVKMLQERAALENAPIDATYRDQNGKWHTMSELADGHRMKELYASELSL